MPALETELLEAYDSYISENSPLLRAAHGWWLSVLVAVVAGGFRSFLTITVEQRVGAPDVTGTRVQQCRTPAASIDKWYSAGGTQPENGLGREAICEGLLFIAADCKRGRMPSRRKKAKDRDGSSVYVGGKMARLVTRGRSQIVSPMCVSRPDGSRLVFRYMFREYRVKQLKAIISHYIRQLFQHSAFGTIDERLIK